MFAEHYEELETKAKKRQMKIERIREASRERKSSIERSEKVTLKPNVINMQIT